MKQVMSVRKDKSPLRLQFQPGGAETELMALPLDTPKSTSVWTPAPGPASLPVTVFVNVSPGFTDAGEASVAVKVAGAPTGRTRCSGTRGGGSEQLRGDEIVT